MNAVWIIAGIEVMLAGILGVALAAADALEDFFGTLLAFNVILGAIALGGWLISRGVS
jgi:hypothetical protein